jgi:threonine aldolase
MRVLAHGKSGIAGGNVILSFTLFVCRVAPTFSFRQRVDGSSFEEFLVCNASIHQIPIDFRSDNVAPVAPAVLESLAALGAQAASAYGADQETAGLSARFSIYFKRPSAAWPLPSGTAANAMALAALLPQGGSVFCHTGAHILVHENGAVSHAEPDAHLVPLTGENGLISMDSLSAALSRHTGPGVLTLTQASETGACYEINQLTELSALARRHSLSVHIDGARLFPACAGLGVSPAAMLDAANPDALSLGLTKSGGLNTDAVVFFRDALPEGWGDRLRRAGMLGSKLRYASAQLHTLLTDDLALRLASRAVAMAQRLRDGLRRTRSISVKPSASNITLVQLDSSTHAALTASSFQFFNWGAPFGIRLVTSFVTTEADVDALIEFLTTPQAAVPAERNAIGG